MSQTDSVVARRSLQATLTMAPSACRANFKAGASTAGGIVPQKDTVAYPGPVRAIFGLKRDGALIPKDSAHGC